MPRARKRPRTIRVRRVRKRGTATLRRRKAKKFGRKWKAPGIPRTIISSDFQRRSQAVSFEYTQQWAVSPSLMSVANSFQFITFRMNDPTDLFASQLPFAANSSQATAALPDYAAEQFPYGDSAGVVNRQRVNNFANWSKRYEKACVIGSRVTAVLRPKMVYRDGETAAFTSQASGNDVAYNKQFHTELGLDASRVMTFLTDAEPFSTDPESVNTTTHIPLMLQRSGVKSYRMSYTPAGKDGAFCTINYSPKKFNNLNDIKDNSKYWSQIDLTTGDLNMSNDGTTVKPIFGIIGIQKEEMTSPSATTPLGAKKQHDYYIECKYSCTVLFKDPYEIAGTNVPTATGPAPMHDELG